MNTAYSGCKPRSSVSSFKKSKKSSIYLIPRKYSTFKKSILMRLYSPVDSTGNVNMIEKLVLGGTVGLEPGTSRSSARRANLCAIKSRYTFTHSLQCQLPLPTHLTPDTTTFLQADMHSIISTLTFHMPKPSQSTSATL